jgi:tRNA nucleotidyltransferase (CCA-adding enzyme)
LPTVERGSIKLDLHRRDFTFNTLALRLDGSHYGELHDYWGGLSDLRQGLVRVLHSLSFVDDPTRMLRAVRFEQRFDFRIEARTGQLMQEAIALLDRVSGDRIRHELHHIVVENRASEILHRLEQLNLLKAIHPALIWDQWLDERLTSIAEAEPGTDWRLEPHLTGTALQRSLAYIFWMVRLPLQQAQEVCDRLKIQVALRENIEQAIRLWNDLPGLAGQPVSRVTERLDEYTPLARYAIYRAAGDASQKQMILDYVKHWDKIQPGIDGHTLRKMGLAPGPGYRKILSCLRAAWLDGKISSPEEERMLLAALLKENSL